MATVQKQDADTPRQAAQRGLTRLFRPGSIAIAGASPDPKTMGGAILANCDRFDFDGPVHLISPTRSEIAGRPCIPSADELPQGVDAVVLNIPQKAILDAARACANRGVGGLVIFASGFAEAGEEGLAVQEELASICRGAGMAMLGPNCLGYVNYLDGAALSFEPLHPMPVGQRRNVAVIAQSGAVSSAIRAAMLGRGVAVSLAAATGNEAVSKTSDVIDFIVQERSANAIAIYAEQIREPAAFLASAIGARNAGIPVVVLHPGRSRRGREAAQSHTGAMVGDHALMRTAVENEAVVVVDTMDELLDTVALLHRFPKPATGDLGIITNSGAVRGMSFDFAEDVGLTLAPMTDMTRERIAGLLPANMEIDNPLDIGTTGYADATIFRTTTAAMLADEKVGGLLLSVTGGGPAQQRAKADAIVPEALTSSKPVAVAVIGDESPLDPDFRAAMIESETPLYRSPERAMRAFAAASRYADALKGADDRTAPATGLSAWPAAGVKPEYVGKAFLRDLGIRVPDGKLVKDRDTARTVAQEIGYPVVLKAQAAALSHKSDAGGVILNIGDEAGLLAEWDRLMANIGTTEIDGVLVERMSAPGVEMIVGARHHAEWGASLLVGLGGVLTEALDATILLPADISHARAVDRIRGLRGARLLEEFRGRSARDVEAVADAVVRLGAAVRAPIGIEEIEINPLMVYGVGEGVTALDALVVTR
ncbi:acetate--CoA ligase family protein [Pacificimonas sp. ICDLI1SI03]